MYTRFLGVLDESLLHSGFSLAEARVLYELANRERPLSKEIAEALGMDAGYLSRILARFEEQALLERKTSRRDNRSARLTLTKRGRAAFKTLNQLSERQAEEILGKLSPTASAELLNSMRSIESILTPRAEKPAVVLRPHRPGDIGWIIHREAVVYAEEYGWDSSFEALVAKIGSDFLTHFTPKRERCWIAEVDGHNAGHIFLVQHPDEPRTAKLRLLLVESSARGTGLGTTLVNECIAFARLAGYRKIVLWTQSTLVAAHRIYKKAGFRLIKEEPHHSFGQDLIGQTWELDLKKSI
jgi:DNA-binding MarR family transcriptional regulator/GNAT superfamily N-acetyltransferase